ncbi:Trimeric GatFAB AmidoTransferase(AdT) complex subunit [Pleurotus pulmonarius]|nr:Trimeric GatFAB AmidoTransferase(AdT) complex subunit [Pleurotus pulmonarius]KAF4592840.1 Trimeric GatFAB AmidoTransferase(AdT) complex subunit [Pleurotus pulmonarius]KAF4593734.1 Trimeric GatFAB AmidoTransferase(AdT) complex subunit [Pleurotus pulmonarius]
MLSRCLPTTTIRRHATLVPKGIDSSWRHAITLKNDSVNAIVHLASEDASGVLADGPLHKVAIAVKDNICTSSMPTTCSSHMLEDFRSPYNATVVRLLTEAGADLIGKTNLDEFGMGSLNTYSIHGPVVNPFQLANQNESWEMREKRAAGGSSGGSAAAVAADMCYAALGTDTGGSIRLPASYCGVTGFKPSYGLISRYGVVSFADSLDCVGVIAKTTKRVRRVAEAIMAPDPRDPTSASHTLRSNASSHSPPLSAAHLKGLRVGVPEEYFPSELDTSVITPTRRVLSALESLGATIVSVSLPSTPYALSAYYVIACAEASSNLARYDGVEYGLNVTAQRTRSGDTAMRSYAATRSQGFGAEVRKRILLGTYALRADAFDNYFQQALRVRQLVRDDFNKTFRSPDVRFMDSPSTAAPDRPDVDIIVHPTAIQPAPLICDDVKKNGLDAYVQDVLTVPASLAGLPALSIRGGDTDGWPIGVTIVGQWGSDDMVLRVGEMVDMTLYD